MSFWEVLFGLHKMTTLLIFLFEGTDWGWECVSCPTSQNVFCLLSRFESLTFAVFNNACAKFDTTGSCIYIHLFKVDHILGFTELHNGHPLHYASAVWGTALWVSEGELLWNEARKYKLNASHNVTWQYKMHSKLNDAQKWGILLTSHDLKRHKLA